MSRCATQITCRPLCGAARACGAIDSDFSLPPPIRRGWKGRGRGRCVPDLGSIWGPGLGSLALGRANRRHRSGALAGEPDRAPARAAAKH